MGKNRDTSNIPWWECTCDEIEVLINKLKRQEVEDYKNLNIPKIPEMEQVLEEKRTKERNDKIDKVLNG